MKRHLTIYLGLVLTMASCAVLNPDLRYKPNSPEDYYFPLLSAELTKHKNDCIKEKQFPCDFPIPNDTLDEFTNQWYSKHLKSMKAPILYNFRNEGKNIIRFTHLGTWSHPISYSIENINGHITLTYTKSKGLGGYKAKRRIKHERKTIKSETWENILTKIGTINFWDIETHEPSTILDGEEWILEVLIDSKYHFVTRRSPEDNSGQEYAELCRLLMNANND